MQATEEGGALQELQLLVQSLNRKVGESEERYSLLQEQAESLKELLHSEKEQYSQKESMYEKNVRDVSARSVMLRLRCPFVCSDVSNLLVFQIQTFKDIILQKDNHLMEINQLHEQELFKLAAKSDASADLEQVTPASALHRSGLHAADKQHKMFY